VGPRASLDVLLKRQISCFCPPPPTPSLVIILTTLHPILVVVAAAFLGGSGAEDGDKNFEFQFIL